MNLNNSGRSNPVAFLLASFPFIASLLEFGDAIKEIAGMSTHFSLLFLLFNPITLVIGLTIIQYTLAWVIARISGWSKHLINVVLEVALLLLLLALT